MPAPTPAVVVKAFGADQVAPYITNPIPVAAPVTPDGSASYDTGFPALNMTDPTLGGVPPSGADMNGVLYAVSSWCAFLQGGQWPAFSSTVATAQTGYAVGAVVRSGLYTYTNTFAGNTADPASDVTQWIRNVAIYAAVALSGAQNNYALPGPSDYILDVDTAGGDVTFSGFIAQRDGQRLTLLNGGANLLNVLALSGLSTAPRQVRLPTDLTNVQNQSLTIQYSTGAGKWLVA